MKIHMCADIRGMLNNNRRKGSLKGVFKDDNGRGLSDEEARDYLYDCLAKGWRVIPVGDCDNFDYQTGCKGHSEYRPAGEGGDQIEYQTNNPALLAKSGSSSPASQGSGQSPAR